jgi:hypothetical protein
VITVKKYDRNHIIVVILRDRFDSLPPKELHVPESL